MSNQVDCAFVIALREEAEGNSAFGGLAEFFAVTQNARGEFVTFTFNDSQGVARTAVVSVILGMTPHLAYKHTLRLLEQFHPTVVLNLGIAGALADYVGIGDVVVASYADNYDAAGKAVPTADGGFTFAYAGVSHRTDWALFDRIRRFRDTPLYAQWQDRAKRRTDQLGLDVLAAIGNTGLLARHSRLWDGVIASGYTVGAASAFKRNVLEKNRAYLALEMEAAGVAEACDERGVPAIVLKAISDPADEMKGDLERVSKDAVRALAMTNVLDLASTVVRSLLDLPTIHPGDGRDRLLTFAERHFKKQHRHLAADIEGHLKRYDRLFRPLCPSLTPPDLGKNVFEGLAEHIHNSNSQFPLRVNGKPGTGKTTFLTLLFLALYRASKQDPAAPIPVYVNLKRYLVPRRREASWDSKAMAYDDLAMLNELLDHESPRRIAILIDGVDEYVRYDDDVEQSVLQLVNRRPGTKQVVAVGLNYLYDKERFRRELPHFNNPQVTVHLEAIRIQDTERCAELADAFLALEPARAISDQRPRDALLDRAHAFALRTIDLLLVDMLAQSLRWHSDAKPGPPADFFIRYCEHLLQGSESTETLADAARLAFEYTVKGSQLDLQASVRLRSWKLLHSHPVIADFLVAYHATQTIRAAGRGAHDRLPDLDYVYPQRVNRFCKDLANSSREAQFEVLEGAKYIYARGGGRAKPHACYLAGRLQDHDAQQAAVNWLRQCRTDIDRMLRARLMDETELLLARTVYISLAYLGDGKASEDYVRLLLERKDWNDVNRGFHLEYYDDIPFEPDKMLSHHDPRTPFHNTYQSLRDRILLGRDNPSYGLLNVEIFTLFSLAQHRHTKPGALDDATREELLAIIPLLLESDHLIPEVRHFLVAQEQNLRAPNFSVGGVVEVLYRLKTERRAGWLKRGLSVERIESVAEHMFGAYLLGLVFLPDGNPFGWRDYSKDEVLRMVLCHDLAEAITGDYTPEEATDAKRQEELAAMTYLRMCGTYPDVASFDGIFSRWEDFEHQTSENARIARDLDKLDNLFQLYVYSKQVVINDRKAWSKQLSRDLGTTAGRRILKIIKAHFENQSPRPD